MFKHERAEHVARVLVARSEQPGSLAERMSRQRQIGDAILKATDVDRIDALVITAHAFQRKFPH